MSDPTPNQPPRPKYHRSAKNYLLDRPFQLKYTGYLVGIAASLSVLLGAAVGYMSSQAQRQSEAAVAQGQKTVEQSRETVERGKELVELSRRMNKVVAMNIAEKYPDDPELAKTFGADTDKDEAKLREQQKNLERDAEALVKGKAELEHQAERIATQHQTLTVALVALLSLLVVLIGLAGIVVTHRVAGPIFKMKRLLRQVGEGNLVVKEKLRRGDELHHFFETFEGMVGGLRERQQEHVADLDEVIRKMEGGPSSSYRDPNTDGVEQLKKVRSRMQAQLEG